MNTSKKKMAGVKSGIKRTNRQKIRHFLVLAAFERLPLANQVNPFADESIDLLQADLQRPASDESAKDPPLSDKMLGVLDETIPLLLEDNAAGWPAAKMTRHRLVKDLIQLGVRSRRKTHRS